jgi:hypothetical protein
VSQGHHTARGRDEIGIVLESQALIANEEEGNSHEITDADSLHRSNSDFICVQEKCRMHFMLSNCP